MPVSWSWAVEWSADGTSFTDITRDVVKSETVNFKRGMTDVSPTACVADPGVLSLVLDNSEANSAGLLGYYSPGHTNCRTGFAFGSYLRLKLVSGATTRYKWTGRIRVIDPEIGQFKGRTVYVQAVDYIQYFVDNLMERVAIQENKRFDELMTAILPTPAPLNTSFDTDPGKAVIAFHLERDEQTSLMEVAQKICQSALGKLYVIGNATDGETLRYEMFYTRSSAALALTLDNTMSEMDVNWDFGSKYNRVKASMTPYSADSEVVVLGSLESEIPIRSGKTEVIELRLRDPNGDARISGFDFVTTLEAGTDYKMSSSPGTTNSDMNPSLTVTATFGSNTVQVSITNNGGITGYLNTLQVRGKGIYPYDVVDFNYGSGNNILTYAMPYVSNANRARSIGQVIYNRAVLNVPTISGISFLADANDTLMQAFLTTDISSRVKVIEAVSGVSLEGFINGWEAEIENGATLKVGWLFVPAETAGNYFTLDDAVKGELDNVTYLLGV